MAINQFVGFTQPVLPSVLSDSYSYYEVLSALIVKTNELIEQVNNLENVSTQYTDEQVAILKSTLENEIQNTKDALSKAIELLSEKENNDYTTVQNELTSLYNTITTEINVAIEEYNTWLIDYLSKQLIDIKVINFFNGEKVNVQTMFDTLAMLHVTNGLTYTKMNERLYTYAEIISICNNGSHDYKDMIMNANTILPIK